MRVNKIVLSNRASDMADKTTLINQVYLQLQDLSLDYHGFYNWYYSKVVPDLQLGIRNMVVVCCDKQIAGIAITKQIEKKICTLRVNSDFQKSGIGKILFEETFSLLNTEKPIITVSELRSFEFRRILHYYGFKLEKVYPQYYNHYGSELSYNGLIEPSPSWTVHDMNKVLAN